MNYMNTLINIILIFKYLFHLKMKEKQLQEAYFYNNKFNKKDWTKDTWKNLPISQQPEYIDTELLKEITEKVLSKYITILYLK